MADHDDILRGRISTFFVWFFAGLGLSILGALMALVLVLVLRGIVWVL